MSQSTTNINKPSTVTIAPIVPKGYELVKTETLKNMFSLIDKYELQIPAAEKVIEAQKIDNQKAIEIISKQDSIIDLYKHNEYNFDLLNQALEKTRITNEKQIGKLNKKVKFWRRMTVVVPTVLGATAAYFIFIK